MSNPFAAWLTALPRLAVAWTAAAAQGDATRGALAFRQCADRAEISAFIRKECPQ